MFQDKLSHSKKPSELDLMKDQLKQYYVSRIARHNKSLSSQNESLKEQIKDLEVRINLERCKQRSIDFLANPSLEEELRSLQDLFKNSQSAFRDIEGKIMETRNQNQGLDLLLDKINSRSEGGTESEELSFMESHIYGDEMVITRRPDLSNTTAQIIDCLSKKKQPYSQASKSGKETLMVWSHLIGLKF